MTLYGYASIMHGYTMYDTVELLIACRRQTQLRSRVPPGYHLFNCTGEGNCLYCSASISLNGDESLANLMRVASVLHAVSHIEHYIKMVCCSLYALVNPIQFLDHFRLVNNDWAIL